MISEEDILAKFTVPSFKFNSFHKSFKFISALWCYFTKEEKFSYQFQVVLVYPQDQNDESLGEVL